MWKVRYQDTPQLIPKILVSSTTALFPKASIISETDMSRKKFGANKGGSFSASLSHSASGTTNGYRKCVYLRRTVTEWTAGNFLWYYNIDNHTTLDMVVRGVGGMPAATVHGAQGAHTSAQATTIYGSWFLKGKGKSGQKWPCGPTWMDAWCKAWTNLLHGDEASKLLELGLATHPSRNDVRHAICKVECPPHGRWINAWRWRQVRCVSLPNQRKKEKRRWEEATGDAAWKSWRAKAQNAVSI